MNNLYSIFSTVATLSLAAYNNQSTSCKKEKLVLSDFINSAITIRKFVTKQHTAETFLGITFLGSHESSHKYKV